MAAHHLALYGLRVLYRQKVLTMNINYRQTIDDGPISRMQWAVVVLATSVLFLDGMDFQIAAFAAPLIMREWHLTKPMFAPLLAAALVGMAFGSLIGSWAGDKFGRRPTIIFSVAFFGLLTILCAFVTSPVAFGVLRFLGGLGLGSALPVALATISEWMPSRVSGKAISISTLGIPAGIIIGAVLASRLLVPFGWRHFFVIVGSICVVASALLAWRLPESPAYLVVKGRYQEVHRLLISAWKKTVGDGVAPFEHSVPPVGQGELFTKRNTRANTGLWLSSMCAGLVTYGIAGWLIVALTDMKVPLATALRGSITYSTSAIVGTLVVGWLLARWGSRLTMIALAVLAFVMALSIAASIYLVGLTGAGYAIIFLGLAGLGFGLSGVLAANYVVAANIYPTAIRARGIGITSAVSRIGAILSSFVGSAMLVIGGGPAFFTMVAGFVALIAIGALVINRHLAARRRATLSGMGDKNWERLHSL